ncbi:MAG: hypothetical protein HF300_05795 [Ignavibacteria bacterium]|jgi:hypothetical protein|nr:hypothetical protein [Ignavibacteria bacterium]MCU7498755.1 hypothetical protein [Ignavibacteria bacterium]MCU7512051.1 hypothetical protein [Ignavibacteria bacterium]MCU7520584.1 hypothetical protein [Ignavibacteria bacterium]MCU7523482.1 hypothetical protein [Ignavibacteria bacterium]
MKKILFFLLIIPALCSAQYYGERAAEKSFQNSDMYFKSHYLNTFALPAFRQVAAGFVRDPFLDLFNNPASLPDLNGKEIKFYMDFRGDREVPSIVGSYVPLNFYAPADISLPDRRWISTARMEPEPVVSIGLLTYPVKEINKSFFLGATYQLIHREEKYYSMPYFIYTSRYGYDAFNAKVASPASDIPIIDREANTDEMLTSGHLFSAFMGFRVLSNLTFGLSLNGVSHSRAGEYLNLNNSEYGNTSQTKYSNSSSEAKDEKYRHLDISAGVSMEVSPLLTLGLKGGFLSGKADQAYNEGSSYFYQYRVTGQLPDWSYNMSNSVTEQSWSHKGTTKYLGVNFIKRLPEGKEIAGFYRYNHSNIDLSSLSAINDTSYSDSRWVYNYDSSVYISHGYSFVHDSRTGSGEKTVNSHEAMINFKWDLTQSNTLLAGFYYNYSKSSVLDNEPVVAGRYSEYTYNSRNYNNFYINGLKENKILNWNYTAEEWTLQIPVLLYFKLHEKFGLWLGVNRILRDWEIHDVTVAYFNSRERNENGVNGKETNFGERYTEPAKKLTENTTDFITKFDLNISPDLKINLLLDPDYEGAFHLAQWWLSFEANL